MTDIFGPEKIPVDLTPEEAFEQGMAMTAYLRLEHGREHNRRCERFKQLIANKRAESVTNPDKSATRKDVALLIATLYGHHLSYSHCIDDHKKAEAYATALTNMGGKL